MVFWVWSQQEYKLNIFCHHANWRGFSIGTGYCPCPCVTFLVVLVCLVQKRGSGVRFGSLGLHALRWFLFQWDSSPSSCLPRTDVNFKRYTFFPLLFPTQWCNTHMLGIACSYGYCGIGVPVTLAKRRVSYWRDDGTSRNCRTPDKCCRAIERDFGTVSLFEWTLIDRFSCQKSLPVICII
jgi:hypothetical protein